MPFHSSLARASSMGRTRLAPLAAAMWLCVAPMQLNQAQEQIDAQTPADEEITAAIEKLEADPNLATERKTRTLRWAGNTDRPQERSGFGAWITNFFVWLGELGLALVWVIGGLLAIALGWFLFNLFKTAGPIATKQTAAMPTHVRDLDIRPESLPADIGAAALDLWQRGDHRAALALLYRGLLSRLAHVHQVPIRDSSTEGDCLALAARHLSAARKDYVAQLVGIWQRAIYGGHDPTSAEVQALCAGFDTALGPSQAAMSERTAG